jgi:hypothetical protein
MRRALSILGVWTVLGLGCGPGDLDAGSDAGAQDGSATDAGVDPDSIQAVHAGHLFSCVTMGDQRLRCWGDVPDGLPSRVGDGASAVAAFRRFCELGSDHKVNCFGEAWTDEVSTPDIEFDEIRAGHTHICGLAGEAGVCWGSDRGQLAVPPGMAIAEIDPGFDHTCARLKSGEVTCWGPSDFSGRLLAPPGTYTSLSTGLNGSCALDERGVASCWGDTSFGDLNVPDLRFREIWIGGAGVSCGREVTGGVACWGDDAVTEPKVDVAPLPVERSFKQLSIAAQACGLTDDRSVRCWGRNDVGQATPPDDLL